MVKPPLAWWRGQRIVTDRDHNLEAIDPGGVEWTALSPMYNLEIKIPPKVRIAFWLLFQRCSSSCKLVILFIVSSCYCFRARGIVSVVCSIFLSKGSKPFM